MNKEPFLISALINKEYYVKILIDSSCLLYEVISQKFTIKHNFKRIKIPKIIIKGYNKKRKTIIKKVIIIRININSY